MSRGAGGMFSGGSQNAFASNLMKIYTWYTGGFFVFVVALTILEQMGLPRNWIGYVFLLATVGLYARIGIMSRTSDAAEYHVARRRVPAPLNGMATCAGRPRAGPSDGHARPLSPPGPAAPRGPPCGRRRLHRKHPRANQVSGGEAPPPLPRVFCPLPLPRPRRPPTPTPPPGGRREQNSPRPLRERGRG